MAGLTAQDIAQLLAKTRQKGLYIQKMNEFLASGELGVSAKSTWVELADKKDTTLKQGFDNAKGSKEVADGAENVRVISQEGDVYLVNLTLAADQVEGVETEAA